MVTRGGKPLLSILLIDDGSMSAAAAALAGLPFSVTIAIDPALPNAADLMTSYRADGFEVAVMAKLPEGAVPSNVEITFESVFASLPETIAVLDIGAGGLQSDRAVTEQAMDILAAQGHGFITASQGLNMAGRAAEQAGVPSVVVFRDLEVDNQDACVVPALSIRRHFEHVRKVVSFSSGACALIRFPLSSCGARQIRMIKSRLCLSVRFFWHQNNASAFGHMTHETTV